MVAKTEFPMFCERENGKLFAFYSPFRIKNTMKKLPQIVYRLANEFLNLKMVKNIFLKKYRPKERRYKHKQNRKILKIPEKQSL
jgi:hypothetical protein